MLVETQMPHGKNKISAAWGDLASRVPWDHFFSFTFAQELGVKEAERTFKTFIRYLHQRTHKSIDFHGALEIGPQGGRTHGHVLLWGTRGMEKEQILSAWKWGKPERCSVDVYDPGRRAAHYAGKTLWESESNWLSPDKPVRIWASD